MNFYKKMPILFLSLPLLLGACVSLKQPSNKIGYYTLEYDPPQITGYKALPIVIRIEHFTVAPTYNTNRIIYKDESFKRNAYVYHKWSDNPGNLCAHFLSRDIQQSGLFKAVLQCNSEFPPSYMIEGSVDEFFEWDTKENWNAVLSLSVTLMAENGSDIGKRLLFQKTYNTTKPCEQKNPTALAQAMSQAMSEISLKVIKDIYNCLK